MWKYSVIKIFFAIGIRQVQSKLIDRLVTYGLICLKVKSCELVLIEFALYKCQKEFKFANRYLLPFGLVTIEEMPSGMEKHEKRGL